jgi:hypothetical protein
MEFLLCSNASSDEFDHGLRRLTIPDTCKDLSGSRPTLCCNLTIASNNEELVIVGKFMSDHIRKSSNDLLFRRQIGAFLEFKVANGSRKSKVAIDAAEIYEAACRTYSRLFT